MLKLYWRIVFRPHLLRIVLIAAATFVCSIAEVASIGLIVPVAGIMITPEQSVNNPINSVLQRLAVMAGMSPQSESIVLAGLLVVAGLVVIKNGLTLANTRWLIWLMNSVANHTRVRLLDAYLRSRFDEIMQRGRGAIFEDITKASSSVSSAIFYGAQLLTAATYVLTTLGLLLYLSWSVTLVIAGLVLVGMRYMRTALEDKSKIIGRQLHELGQHQSALMVDALDGARVVKIHTVEATVVARLQSIQNMALPKSVRAGFLAAVPAMFFEVSGILFVVLLVGFVFGIPNSGLTLPTLMAMVVGLRRLLPSASGVNTNLVSLSTVVRHIEVTDEVLNMLPRERFGSRPLSAGGVETIKLENVSFHYPGRKESRVLRDVNLTLKRGQVTALVGHTGAGKSTVANLLVGLYSPSSGVVMVDGIELRELDLGAWRRNIGYVGQDTYLFNDALLDNIVLWDDSVHLDEIEGSARAAQLDEFVGSLPDGYDTIVGDRGLKLSGGQRQRVAIARAILHKPGVLIFDEATSELDNITERAVHGAISSLRAGAIVVIVAHRLGTVQDADQIIVMHDGCVVEHGPYEKLMEQRGRFWELYHGGVKHDTNKNSN